MGSGVPDASGVLVGSMVDVDSGDEDGVVVKIMPVGVLVNVLVGVVVMLGVRVAVASGVALGVPGSRVASGDADGDGVLVRV